MPQTPNSSPSRSDLLKNKKDLTFAEAVERRIDESKKDPIESWESDIVGVFGPSGEIALSRFKQGKGGVSFYLDKDGTPVSELLKEGDDRIIVDGIEIGQEVSKNLRSRMNKPKK